MPFVEAALTWAHLAVLVPLTGLSLHRGFMLWLRWRHRGAPALPSAVGLDAARVTVQLPIYNERFVAARLVDAVASLDHPRDRLQVQVLDDSTDDTPEIVARAIRALPSDLVVEHVRRPRRDGFKAGALAHGLDTATGDLIAVFDADFVPQPEFLKRTLPHFADPAVGMVQARWGHLNPSANLLTEVQAALIDGHFLVEHVARSRSGCLFNFNGTAGVFRRACIDDAGGWSFDSLTEDIDLSYRAQLRGWRFVYRPDIACPAELPENMNAFHNQQYRWAKGAVQVGRKLIGDVWRAPIRPLAKTEATVHLFGNLAFPLLLALILIALPLQLFRLFGGATAPDAQLRIEAAPFALATLSALLYYGVATHVAGRLTFAGLLRLPWLIAVCAGLAVTNTAAVVSAFGPRTGEFVRTPKHAERTNAHRLPRQYRSRRGLAPWLELGLAAYASATAVTAVAVDSWVTGLFHGLFAAGLGWSAIVSLRDDRSTPRIAEAAPSPVGS